MMKAQIGVTKLNKFEYQGTGADSHNLLFASNGDYTLEVWLVALKT